MAAALKEQSSGRFIYLIVGSKPTPQAVIYYQIPKKTVKRAVDRNLIKRRLKSILLPYRPKLPTKTFTLGVKSNIKAVKFEELKTEVEKLLHKYVA